MHLPFIIAIMAAAVPADNDPQTQARAVVERYYAAIDHHDYRTAWLLWARDGQASGKTLVAFKQGFAGTIHSRAVVGTPIDEEGAAGSSFITVPVTVEAWLKDGTRQRFAGSYILRAVNDVDGSTAEERRWHLDSAHLVSVHRQ